jgi:hypothetical protein
MVTLTTTELARIVARGRNIVARIQVSRAELDPMT